MKCAVFLGMVAAVMSQEGNLIVHKVDYYCSKPLHRRAHVHSSQKVESDYPDVYASGANITVQIDLYNVGNGPAREVNNCHSRSRYPNTTN